MALRWDDRALDWALHGPRVKAEARELADAVLEDAQALCPVLTGNLRDSLMAEFFQDPADRDGPDWEYRVGWSEDGWYGWLVEAGTEHSDAQAHLRPAARKHDH